MIRPPTRALLLALALVAACAGTGEPEPEWRRAEIATSSERVLWKVTMLALQKMSFPYPSGDPSTLVLTTGWKNDLYPFRGKGYRTRAEVRLNPVSAGVWEIEARVQKQVNNALVNPLDPSYAEWEWVPDDPELGAILIRHVKSYLGGELELEDRPADPIEAYMKEREGDGGR